MVGVPGKFKGCNTCRARRVKCDNERPFCRKCTDSGRECAGYERETVFIIGTIQDQGRCSSHPPRVVKSNKGKSSSRSAEPEGLELVPTQPLRPAWDDLISVSSRDRNYQIQIAALHTDLTAVSRTFASDNGQDWPIKPVFVSFPPYQTPADVSLGSGNGFQVSSQCLVHLAGPDNGQGSGTRATTDSVCVFLYQHNNSIFYNTGQTQWKSTQSQTNTIKRMGPASFKTFPNHHFFARVYRPNAISTALLNSTSTFLSNPEWLSTPFENHPKSTFDGLLDVLTKLPTLFVRTDRLLIPQDQTISRRLLAQDLLSAFVDIDLQLSQWLATLPSPTPYWITEPTAYSQIPFSEAFAFCDNQTALSMIYYWAACVLFWPRCWRLYWTIFEQPVDAGYIGGGQVDIPPSLQGFDPMRYSLKEVREMAGNVCRGLDWALGGGAQPDLLGWVLDVVRNFYGGLGMESMGLNMGMGIGGHVDGALELGWCEGFRGKLLARGREVQDVVMARRWVDFASY
ncbi:hypothetical protein QBC38DRAFT_514414 [Podospora fimiseda]|uniref:Zn(2)-C6 fungal-type domain-containing protein n=1 Tax=Podospora fimiseda TaxID=252190 RepID=A0AAN7BW84_9PEZI|nr:hypothetical protein QBC38DRAFT_514414 [Podospora fimiseda]